MTTAAIYPGSFDPMTNGHASILRSGLVCFDKIVVAVLNNERKQPLFSVDERIAMIEESLDEIGADKSRIEVDSFDGLMVEYARKKGVRVVLRGLRAVADFEYEYQMALMNRHLAPMLETMFMVPSLEVSYVSSSLVREVARFGGDIDALVHPAVARALREKYQSSSFTSNPGPSAT